MEILGRYGARGFAWAVARRRSAGFVEAATSAGEASTSCDRADALMLVKTPAGPVVWPVVAGMMGMLTQGREVVEVEHGR